MKFAAKIQIVCQWCVQEINASETILVWKWPGQSAWLVLARDSELNGLLPFKFHVVISEMHKIPSKFPGSVWIIICTFSKLHPSLETLNKLYTTAWINVCWWQSIMRSGRFDYYHYWRNCWISHKKQPRLLGNVCVNFEWPARVMVADESMA